MGTIGAIIMSFFGAVFAALATQTLLGGAPAIALTPFLVFAVLGGAALFVHRRPGPDFASPPGAGRVIMWSSIAEGVGILVAVNVVALAGHREWTLPAMALVVGLHFVPMALAIPFRPFLVLGVALVTLAMAGIVLPSPLGGALAGLGAATTLWVASLGAILRELSAKRTGLST
jgi:hypothetical protein